MFTLDARAVLAAAFLSCTALDAMSTAKAPARFDVTEKSIAQLQQAMTSGRVTAREIARQYLARIEAIDRAGPKLNAVIEVNPDALKIADALDAERKARGPRGPLHGIPVLIKDNIATDDRHADHGGLAGARGREGRARRVRRDAAARGGRRDPRQDQPFRVGQHPLHAIDVRLERARRAHEESLRAGPQPERLELRIRRRGRREPRRRRRGHRDGRLHHVAVVRQRPRRHQAHAGPREPLGRDPDRVLPGHGRPDGAQRLRRRRAPRRHGRQRSEGSSPRPTRA